MTVYNTKYILSAAVDKRGLLDLRLKAGSLTLDEQQATVTGSAQVDFIYASFGMNLNYSTNSAGVDRLYLDGALNDYTTTVSGSVLTLSRTIGTKTSTYKINTTDDVVVFTNGFATAAALASAVASAGSQTVVLNATENSSTAPELALVESTTRVTLQSSGTVTATAQAAKLIVSGSAGVDVVYIKAGARVDVSGLGGSMDKVYFTGNWSDYAKTVAGSTIKFARTINGSNEEVVVAAGSGTINDRLIFKDGNVGSGAALVGLKTNASVSLLGAGGATGDAAEKSPQAAMASAAITAISHDTGLADLITRDEVQTISGTYSGALEAGEKIQVKVNGVWLDAVSAATTASTGVFSVAGAHLVSGLNQLEVRTYSPSGATVAGVGKDVTLDVNAPAVTLSVPSSQDTTVNASESGVDVVFPVDGLKVGDVLQLKVGGVPVGDPVTVTPELLASPGINLTVPKSALTDGDNAVQAVVRNAAGQTDETNPLVVKLDTQIATPDLSLAATQANGSAWTSPAVNDQYLNASENQVLLTVEGDPADSTKALHAGDSIQLTKDGALLGAAHTVTNEEAAANRVFLSVDTANLGGSDGTHQLAVTVSDAAGNSATSASNLAITVDRLVPKPILSVSDVTDAGIPVTADATLSDSETSIWLKVEGTAAAQGGAFKQGDVITLQSHEGAVATPLLNSSTGEAYQATVATDGAPVYILVNKSDLQGGLNNLSASAADLAGNTDVSAQLEVTVQSALQLTNADMAAHLVNQLEVNSQVVLTANAELSAAVPGKFIRFVNAANSGAKLGFDGESINHTQTIEASDSQFVSIVGNQIFIKPPFDFDFSNNYSIEVDAGAFTSAGGMASVAVTGANDLSFATVTVGGSQADAVQGQYMAASTGALTNGKKWFSIEGMGSLSSAASLDLSGADYALVTKDHNTAGGVPRTSDGVGIGNPSFQVNLTQFGTGDLIYVDDVFNDKTQLNDNALTDVRDNGDGTFTVQFNPDATAGADAGVIHIVSGASSVEGVRGQVAIDNSRMGTPVSAISRVDATGAVLTDYVLSAHETLILKVSSAAYKQGDRVQLAFLDGNGLETALGGEHLVNANDVSNGYVTLTIADPAGLGLLEREDGWDNAIYAKVTNTLGALTHSPVLNDMGGVLYDSRLPTPSLSVATGEDATLSSSESSIHLVVSAAGIQLGDVLELKLGNVTLSALTHTVEEADLSSGYTFTVSKSLLAPGNNTLNVAATDTSGNVGSGSPLVVVVDASNNHPPTVSDISRVDATGAVLTDYVLSAHETLIVKVSSAGYTQGDRVQLAFLDGNGLETALGSEYLVNANDVLNGYVTLTIADPAGLGLLESDDSRGNAIYAKVTNTYGAVAHSSYLNDLSGVLYDSRLPTPSLSIAPGEDATLSSSESSIHLVVSAAGIQLGDVLELKLGDVTLSALTHTVDEADLSSGYTFTVSKSLLASGNNTLNVAATDTSGNVGSATPLVVVVEASINHAPAVSAPLSLNVTEGDASQVVNLLTNASDADTGETATLSFQNVTYTVDGSATASGGTALPAGLTLTGTELTLDPSNPVFDSLTAGQSRTIVASYQVKDVHNATVNQTATITIAGRNDAPTVSAPLSANVLEINSTSAVNYNLNLLTNASDPDAGQTATLTIQNPTYTIDGAPTANGGAALPSGVTLSGSTLTVDRTHAAWNDLAANETRSLVVSYQVKDASNATVNQTATITITGVNDGLTGAPTISGTMTEGQTMTANNGTLADPDGLNIVSYQWHRVTVDSAGTVLTDEAISGATSSTYVLGASDVDRKIYVSITNNDGNGTTTGTSESKNSVLSSAWVTNFLNPADVSATALVQRTTVTNTAVSTWSPGKSIFTAVQAPTDTDITAIKMVFSGTGFTDGTADTLVLNATDIAMASNLTGTGISLGGVSGINFNYASGTKTLLLTHGDVVPSATNLVTAFSAAEVAAISNAVKLKLTAASTYKTDIFFGDSGMYHNEAFSAASSATHTVV